MKVGWGSSFEIGIIDHKFYIISPYTTIDTTNVHQRESFKHFISWFPIDLHVWIILIDA